MLKSWPLDKIRELLALAEATGEARATLANAREANLFRQAIYNFRRKRSGVGEDITITIADATVVLAKKDKPSVAILHQQTAWRY